MLDALPELLGYANVIHQCGTAPGLTTTYRKLAAASGASAAGTYALFKFLDADAMGDAYAIASLVVSRSGAGTTNEHSPDGQVLKVSPARQSGIARQPHTMAGWRAPRCLRELAPGH